MDSNTFEIQVVINDIRYALDVTGVETVPLNKSVSDITDITAVNGAWSKSITLPWTKRNIAAFTCKQDVSASSDFNPNDLNRAFVIVNGVTVQEGNFVMKEITINHFTGKKVFTIDIVGDSIDIYSKLGEKELETLLGLTAFDHKYSVVNMVTAQAATSSYKLGYDYPMIDYGYDWTIPYLNQQGAWLNKFKPAMYVRPVFDQIFKEEDFKWTSNSLTQSTTFDKLILPFTGKELTHTDDYVTDRAFRIGMNTDMNIILPNNYPANIYSPGWPATSPFNYPSPIWQSQAWPAWLIPSGQIGPQNIQLNNESSPNGDPNSIWSQALYSYTNTTPYPITQKFCFNVEIDQMRLWPYYDSNGTIRAPSVQLCINGVGVQTCDQWNASNFLPVWEDTNGGPPVWSFNPNGNVYGQLAYQKYIGKWKSPSYIIYPGDVVTVRYQYNIGGNFQSAPTNGVPAGTIVARIIAGPPGGPGPNGTYIWNEVDKTLGINELIEVTSTLPKKFKRRDLLMAIIKMYNLIVEADPDNPNTLKIETRDYYYSTGVIENWNDKIDRSVPYKTKILGDTSKNRIIFKYKDDKDYFNTDYKNRTQRTYGQYAYNSGNKNVKGDKTVEIAFSPTPMVTIPFSGGVGSTASSTITIPKIGTVNGQLFAAAAANPRILIRKPKVPCQDTIWIEGHGWVNYYPYAGHLDDPNNPSVDINFGQVSGFYYPQTNTTGNNLFNTFWRNMIEEIYDKDSEIIIAQVNLNPVDYATFKFNKRLYIDFYGTGYQYYRVNKIEQYDPVKKQSCTVEFLKVKDIVIPRKPLTRKELLLSYISGTIKYDGGNGNGNGNQSGKAAPPNSGGGIVLGEGSYFMGGGSSFIVGGSSSAVLNIGSASILNGFSSGGSQVIFGDQSNSSSGNTFIVGNNSNIGIGSTGSQIMGDSSGIQSNSNGIIIGDNSFIVSGPTGTPASDVIIIGNNVRADSDNSGQIVMGSVVVTAFSSIDSGQDEILGVYGDLPYNLIVSGQDEIRGLGSTNNLNGIDGGQDRI